MKKRIWLIASAFLALASIPLFSATDILEVSAATDLGTIKVAGHEKSFSTSVSLETAMSNLMSGDCKNDYVNKDVILTLYGDVTASDFLPKNPSGSDLWHRSVTINLNGHTLTVTGARQHSLGSLVINGGGGRINFSSVNYGDPIFYFNSNSGGNEFTIKDTTFENMCADQLFYVNECSDTITASTGITIENCFFNNGSFDEEGGILYFNDGEIETINIFNSGFRCLSSDDYGSAIYIGYQKLKNLNIKGTLFFDCDTDCDGGAIYIHGGGVYVGNSSSLTYDKNFIYNCSSSSGWGGGIYANNPNTKIQNFTFFNCSSDDGGGAICLNDDNSQILNCAFYNNHTTDYGGAIYVEEEECKIANSIICYNTSTNYSTTGREIYCDEYCELENNKIYFYNETKLYNCNAADAEKDSNDPLLFTDARNYKGSTLIRGNSQENPILINNIHDLFVFYFNLKWDEDYYSGVYSTKHYLLTTSLPGFMGFYDNLKDFSGTFNFGGNFLKCAVNWVWPGNHTINPYILDLSDTLIHKDGHIEINVNGKREYYKPICHANIDFTTLKTGNYYFYENVTFNDRLVIDGDVNLLFNAGITVNCNVGINVSSGNKLKIIGTDPNHKAILNAISSNIEGAGIGGGYGCLKEDTKNDIIALTGETMGDVTIQNMKVNATGSGGAGIGGGAGMDGRTTGATLSQHAAPGGDGGTLTIQDSEIVAVGNDGRDIGGGNGGNGANEPSGGGAGTEIIMKSGTITATTNGIGGGHCGTQGNNPYGNTTKYGSKHGGDGGKIDFTNGTIIAKGLGGGDGLLDSSDKADADPNGAAANLNIPNNYGISFGEDLRKMSLNQKYNSTLNPSLRKNYVKIKLLVTYKFNIVGRTGNTCLASYVLNGETYSELVNTIHCIDQMATCTDNEVAHEHATFSDSNIESYDSVSAPVDGTALGHSYGGQVEYVRDGGKVTASWHCQRSNCDSIQTETTELKYKVDTPATCTENEMGHLEGEFKKGFPMYKTEKNSEVIQDTFKGHKISGQTTYNWNGDSCTASAFCITCNKIVSETVKGAFVQDIPENCVDPEKGHYHAEYKFNFPSNNSPEAMTAGPTQPYGHDFHNNVVYEWNYETYECTATVMCKNRDCDEITTESVQGVPVYDIQPTCVDNAIGHYVANFTKLPGIFITQMTEYAGLEIPNSALGHHFEGKITYYWDTQTNKCTASWHCSRCEVYESETVDGIFEQDTPPTCEDNAKGHCLAVFENENFNTGQSTEPNGVEIPNTALGHEFGGPISYEWDEQTLQWTGYQGCQRDGCDGIYSETCDGKFVETVPPTCLDDAKGYYISDFKTAGFEQQTTTKTDYINKGSALGHDFGGEITYVWNKDTHECTATWGCVRDGCNATQSETVQGEYLMDTEATCLTNEFGHFEAHFSIKSFQTQYTEKNSFEKLFTALGHEFGGVVSYQWNEETHECTATWGCVHGGCAESETETAQGFYAKDSDATCLENEKGHYEANFVNPGFETQSTTISSVEIPDTALGHKWGGNIVYSWNSVTHECTALMKCDHAGCSESQIEKVQGVYVKDSDATCLENEKGHYEAIFANSYFKTQTSEQVEIADTAFGHDIVITYQWNDDYTECVGTASCTRGDHVETVVGKITYEYGYAIAKFDDSRFKTQSVKMVQAEKEITPEEKNEKLVSYIFAGSCGGLTLAAIIGIIIAIKRKVF